MHECAPPARHELVAMLGLRRLHVSPGLVPLGPRPMQLVVCLRSRGLSSAQLSADIPQGGD